eukprot:UN04175
MKMKNLKSKMYKTWMSKMKSHRSSQNVIEAENTENFAVDAVNSEDFVPARDVSIDIVIILFWLCDNVGIFHR